MRYIDTPPFWLLACLIIAWWLGNAQPFGLAFGAAWLGLPAGLLIGEGVLLIALAEIELNKWRTPITPRQAPRHLVQSGIFRRSRNPIYLGRLAILAGAILYWDAPLALPLLPVLLWIFETRFIEGEERRLRQRFKADYHRYTEKTRRWL